MEIDKLRHAQHTSNVVLGWLTFLVSLNISLTIGLLMRVNQVVDFFEELGRIF